MKYEFPICDLERVEVEFDLVATPSGDEAIYRLRLVFKDGLVRETVGGEVDWYRNQGQGVMCG